MVAKLASLLTEEGHRTAPYFLRLLSELRYGDADLRREVVRDLASRPTQDRFDALRDRLFAAVRAELRSVEGA